MTEKAREIGASHGRGMTRGSLWIVPALSAREADDGRLILTRKFIEGVHAYQRLWPGSVAVAMMRDDLNIGSLDEVAIRPQELGFVFEWLPDNDDARVELFRGSGIVLASLVEPLLSLTQCCSNAGVPVVFNAEYSLRTRQQIVRTETRNPIILARRLLWVTRQESRFRHAIAVSQGVQCNGTPTADAYRTISPNMLLYFDSRVMESEVIGRVELEKRISEMMEDRPLRLAFSGRLISMKGADHLVRFIDELCATGVRFELDVCGEGPCRAKLLHHVERLGLGDRVRLRGVLEFHTELLPFLRRSIDLFVCPHKQGDPSCTYLETFACGVPIAGYDNEAAAGLMRLTDAGWLSPLNDPRALARRIAWISKDRAEIARASRAARAFAGEHTFDQTTRERIDHLLVCMSVQHRSAAC